MREALDALSDRSPPIPDELHHQIPVGVPWKQYVSRHELNRKIIGSGIVRAELVFQEDYPNDNRWKTLADGQEQRQLRLDYEFENADGVICQMHPGKKASGDAIPIWRQVRR